MSLTTESALFMLLLRLNQRILPGVVTRVDSDVDTRADDQVCLCPYSYLVFVLASVREKI